MTRIILHIGTHKTGTTSIQESLSRSRRFLLQNGLRYPDGLGIIQHHTHHHHRFAHGINAVDSEAFQVSARFAQALQTSRQTILISSEPIYRHIHGYDGWHFDWIYDYWTRWRRYLSDLKLLLGTEDIRVVIAFRAPHSFQKSLYNELVRRTIWTETYERFCDATQHLTDYDKQLAVLGDVFKHIDVLSYEQWLENGGSVAGFWHYLGLQCPAGDEGIWLRRSENGTNPIATPPDGVSATSNSRNNN